MTTMTDPVPGGHNHALEFGPLDHVSSFGLRIQLQALRCLVEDGPTAIVSHAALVVAREVAQVLIDRGEPYDLIYGARSKHWWKRVTS